MSFPSLCAACELGDHEQHLHGTVRKGLIGGSYCPCEGDCKPSLATLAFLDAITKDQP